MKALLKLAAMLIAVAMFTSCGNTAKEEEEIVDEITTEEVVEVEVEVEVEEVEEDAE